MISTGKLKSGKLPNFPVGKVGKKMPSGWEIGKLKNEVGNETKSMKTAIITLKY
jgi:hypothetical protein